ncbi:MAG: BrnA antitoxin family protein [Elusimicrobiota bacterium]
MEHKKLKEIPRFNSEKEEADFWSNHSTVDYVDWSKAKRAIFPNLKPTSRSVPIRFPLSLFERLKFLANKNDMAYQTLVKLFLTERVEKELRSAA